MAWGSGHGDRDSRTEITAKLGPVVSLEPRHKREESVNLVMFSHFFQGEFLHACTLDKLYESRVKAFSFSILERLSGEGGNI